MKAVKTENVTEGFEGWYYPAEDSDRCIVILAGSKGNDLANRMLAGWINHQGCCALGFGKWQNREQMDGVHEWPLELGGFMVRFFQSGKKNPEECRESRKRLDRILSRAIRCW